MKEYNIKKIAVRGSRFIWTIACSLFAIEIFLVCSDVFVNYSGYVENVSIKEIFGITFEKTLGNWFSSSLFLFASLLLALISLKEDFKLHPIKKIAWLIFTLLFFYLSADDGAKIHERVGNILGDYVDTQLSSSEVGVVAQILGGFPSYYWQIVYLPILGTFGAGLFLFLWEEARAAKARLLLVGAFGSYALAIAMDYLEGVVKGFPLFEKLFTLNPKVAEHSARVFEEFLEMFATTQIITLLLILLVRELPRSEIHFKDTTQ